MQLLDIVIPIWNEQESIQPLLKRLDHALKKAHIKYHAVLVDDHSTDNSAKIIKSLVKKYPITYVLKKGQRGKAFSILEGTHFARSENIAMIDGDLQYPPEAIPAMFKLLTTNGVVIGKRNSYQASLLRKIANFGFKKVFARVFFNLNYDVQSGLKLFKKEIITQIKDSEVSGWTLDLPLLHTASSMGFPIAETPITFSERKFDTSKVNLLKTSFEIGSQALKLKLKGNKQIAIASTKPNSMVGAGIFYKGKRLITHTTLEPKVSAAQTFTLKQKLFILSILLAVAFGLFSNVLLTFQILIAILSFIYFFDALFNFIIVYKSLHKNTQLTFSDSQLAKIKNSALPIYTILCPLYREASVLPNFLQAIAKIDWPKNKLDVQLLLEEDDLETIQEAKRTKLPSYVQIRIVPDSFPKTKPKACNFGLNFAKGEYLVIYDAEDIPDPLQLKKAYLGFQNVADNVVCLQAKLNYFNPHQNLLTRLFTAEYSLWFDVILPGFQLVGTTIPLGGTSNHFKTHELKLLKGWDPFNVTEDCDLGTRLFMANKKTAIIDSTTYEEANSDLKNWIRQRSRWIKGYMQTYLVHMRDPISLFKKQGIHALIFQLIIGARISFMIINPLLWIMTISYFLFYKYTSQTIEALFPTLVFYLAVFSLLFGNFAYLYNYMIGAALKGQFFLIKYVLFIPFYWVLGSAASVIAFYQLFTKPHYWEKTVHGLYLKSPEQKKISNTQDQKKISFSPAVTHTLSRPKKLPKLSTLVIGGTFFIGATIFASVCNFLFNAFLGRVLTFEQFGTLSLFSSISLIILIPLSALAQTITHKTAFLFGKYSKQKAYVYIQNQNRRFLLISLVLTVLWILAIPVMERVFKIDGFLPFLLFAPSLAVSLISANLSGYLRGTLALISVGIITILSGSLKLLLALILVQLNLVNYLVVALSLSVVLEYILYLIFAFDKKITIKRITLDNKTSSFDLSFFITSLFSNLSVISFLGLDIILAKLYLSPLEAGQYGILNLVGKITFFLGTLFTPFIIPLVSKNLGLKKGSDQVFIFQLALTTLICLVCFITLGIFGSIFVPMLIGSKALSITPYLPIFILSVSLFTITNVISLYFQAKRTYIFVLAGVLILPVQIIASFFLHKNLNQFVWMILLTSVVNLIFLSILYRLRKNIPFFISNLFDFLNLFSPNLSGQKELNYQNFSKEKGRKILIFNWRDTQHKFAGGAEVYIHELAKRWVQDGNEVTVFCGNDGHCPRFEIIDGIKIIRRGGFYTVYFWAAMYYIFKFKSTYDLIIDSENGIPFLTPLYVMKPKILIIHHVHQAVFRKYLPIHLSLVAQLIESYIMPRLYKNNKIITVSHSSKKAIEKANIASSKNIEIVHNGVNLVEIKKTNKTQYPSFVYIGRLKAYKRVDLAIEAFSKICKKYPKSKLFIAGSGESLADLKKKVGNLNLVSQVKFLGKVTEEEKAYLFAKSWVALQPSLFEGWGITVIEANAFSTPVVAFNVNGLKDSVINYQTGILVRKDCVKDYSKAMEVLIKDRKLRKRLSNNALAWSKNFDWQKSSRDFYSIMENHLNNQVLIQPLWRKAIQAIVAN